MISDDKDVSNREAFRIWFSRLQTWEQEALILDLVSQEMQRQIQLWGVQHHPDGTGSYDDAEYADSLKQSNGVAALKGTLTWARILEEEVFEALAETDPAKLIEELTQVAAVAASWIRDIRSRTERP